MMIGTALYPKNKAHNRERIKKEYRVLLFFQEVSFTLSENNFTGATIMVEQTSATATKNHIEKDMLERYTDCQ